jgi:hypothetical protein
MSATGWRSYRFIRIKNHLDVLDVRSGLLLDVRSGVLDEALTEPSHARSWTPPPRAD